MIKPGDLIEFDGGAYRYYGVTGGYPSFHLFALAGETPDELAKRKGFASRWEALNYLQKMDHYDGPTDGSQHLRHKAGIGGTWIAVTESEEEALRILDRFGSSKTAPGRMAHCIGKNAEEAAGRRTEGCP